MSDDSGLDVRRPSTWLDAFAWIKGAVSAPDDPWWEGPIEEPGVARQQHVSQITELAMARLSHWAVGQLFPSLSPDVDLLQLTLPVRALNALGRHGCLLGSDILALSVRDIMSWHNVGVGTVDAILRELADISTSRPTPSVASSWVQDDWISTPTTTAQTPEWMTSVRDDLELIATWYSTVGHPMQRVFGSTAPAGTPEEVAKAWHRLAALSASDVLDPDAVGADIAARFDAALGMLDPRALRILSERLFSDEPRTLDEIGRDHGVTRERIRQIEGKARGAMLTAVSDGGQLDMVARTVRTLIGTIRPLDDLMTLMPALSNPVTSVGQPAWRVLDRLDDAYEIEDGWCVVPTITAARATTQTQLQERANRYGVARIDDINLVECSNTERLAEVTAAWLAHCGYIVDGGFVLTRTQSVQDYGAAILVIEGSPLSVQEIVDRFVVERSPSSLRNGMSSDERFERVDRDRWALREWGLEGYGGVRSVIRQRVTHAGGRVNLDELVEHITSRYSVSSSSVVAYASAPPFQCRAGMVSLAQDDREIRKTPERTRRLYRRTGAWAYRVRITTDHLRGSGSVAPVAIASLLDLQFGQTRHLPSPLGPQAIAWTAIQPSFGTVRRFLLDSDIAADTEAFLVIHDTGTFSFEPTRDMTGDPLVDALILVGAAVTTDPDEARHHLGAAVGLPPSTPVTSIIGRYRERGDSDIADLLTNVRDYLEAEHVSARPTEAPAIDDILELL